MWHHHRLCHTVTRYVTLSHCQLQYLRRFVLLFTRDRLHLHKVYTHEWATCQLQALHLWLVSHSSPLLGRYSEAVFVELVNKSFLLSPAKKTCFFYTKVDPTVYSTVNNSMSWASNKPRSPRTSREIEEGINIAYQIWIWGPLLVSKGHTPFEHSPSP